MTRLFELRSVPTDVAIRAIAITTIVVHHAYRFFTELGYGLAGGMTVLMMLAGMNMGRFGARNATGADLRGAIARYGLRLLIPALVMLLVSFALLGRYSVTELLFVKNWFTPFHIALFPEWYVQVMLQMLAFLYLLASIPVVSRAFIRAPNRSILILFVVALAVRVAGPRLWDTRHLFNQLPYLYLWNFTLGGVIYSLGQAEHGSRTWLMRGLALGCLVGGAALAWTPGRPQFWWLIAGGALVIVRREIPLPVVLVPPVILVSSAAYAIFLTHMLWFEALTINGRGLLVAGYASSPPIAALVALVGGTAIWVLAAAFARAYRAVAPSGLP